MTTTEALALLEGCSSYEQALRLLYAAVETQWSDGEDVPVGLGTALDALDAAANAFAALDEVVR